MHDNFQWIVLLCVGTRMFREQSWPIESCRSAPFITLKPKKEGAEKLPSHCDPPVLRSLPWVLAGYGMPSAAQADIIAALSFTPVHTRSPSSEQNGASTRCTRPPAFAAEFFRQGGPIGNV